MTREIRWVGIIGAGQMGQGIAQVMAQAGIDVYINDISTDKIDAAIVAVTKALKKPIDLKRAPSQAMLQTYWNSDAAIGRLHPAYSYVDFGDCDLVIEAATENETVKHKILREVADYLRDDAILATNTSSISINELAEGTCRANFLGIHFMNPVPVMGLVELIRNEQTSDDVFEAIKTLIERLGKTAVEAQDKAGFIVNRVLIPMINDAICTLDEGVGTVAGIDAALKLGAGQPMGPLALADLIGLDTVLSIMRVLAAGISDKYVPSILLEFMVESGNLGRKTGKGFWDYTVTPPAPKAF